MAQKKSHEVDGWLRRPDPAIGIVLIYGPDRGLVSERAAACLKGAGIAADDPFSLVRLTDDDVGSDPGRLIDEMRSIPMFSDRRLVWWRTSSPVKAAVEAVRALADGPIAGATLLIEAGDMKKGSPLRSLVEGAGAAMALPCYADEARSLDAIIDDALAKSGMSISLEARMALKRNLGGDRLASRSEIEKLVLYAHGEPQITLQHVEALSGDASNPSLDAIVDVILLGRLDDFDTAFARAAAGNQMTPLLSAALRQFHAIDLMRDQVEHGGKTAAGAVAAARPPVFFSRRETVEKAVSRWSKPMIGRALERLQKTVFESREQSALGAALARQTLLALAVESARRSH